jgi:hypothetical protein
MLILVREGHVGIGDMTDSEIEAASCKVLFEIEEKIRSVKL